MPSPQKQPDTHEPDTHEPDTHEPDTHEPDTREPETREPDTHEPDTREPDTREPDAPVAHVSPLCVFGLPPFWCIVTCPTCDTAGYMQEDVHALPPAPRTQCAHGHVYKIEIDKNL